MDDIDDTELLKIVAETVNQNSHLFIIPDHMKKGIEQGLYDTANGHVYSMEDFEKNYGQWLN